MIIRDKTVAASHSDKPTLTGYRDELHGESLDEIEIGEHGYKFRILDGIVMPPYITPERYRTSRQLETRAGDICYISFPKSGSTWLSYILVLLSTGGKLPQDSTLRDNLHWVASSYTYPRSREELDALPSPRIFKSHMPYTMALGGTPHEQPCRYVYIARNPKDVVVSYFHFERDKSWTGSYDGDWDHWFEMFLDGRVQRGDWFDHVLSWWEQRHRDNIHFLFYEDLLADFDQQLERLAAFLELPLEAEVAATIRRETAFSRMSRSEFSNLGEIAELDQFFRKGKAGSWTELFTPEQNKRFDDHFGRRTEGTGLSFSFAENGGRE